MRIETVLAAMAAVMLISCSASRRIEKELQEKSKETNHFTGVVVYDLEKEKELLNVNGGKYFTPASNVKLFTFYTAWKTLKDSAVAFQFVQNADSLILRGCADPGFLRDSTSLPLLDLLSKSGKKLFLEDVQLEDDPFGPGWSWDDYQYGYMPERSVFPIYGNTVKVKMEGDSLIVEPNFFRDKVHAYQRDRFRHQDRNEFYLIRSDKQDEREVPFKTSNQLVADLLGEALGEKVTLIPPKEQRIYSKAYRTPYDSLYTRMLVDSDNFIAEQLMLQVAYQTEGTYAVPAAINYALQNYLPELPQQPRWVDGSGLSRYNLFSPSSLIHLLQKMHREMPEEKLLSYFPVGGQSGTLKNGYSSDTPYVYAKSGTLSNNYALSGFMRTKKGKILAFSYMTNHYQGRSADRKKEIAAFLDRFYKAY